MLTVVGFLVASLVVPAATKQWSDRPDELQLKRELVADVTRLTTETVILAHCVVTQCTFDHLRTEKPPEEALLEATADLYQMNRQVNNEWSTFSEEIRTLLRTYFPESGLPAEWTSFSEAVSAYLRIGSGECGAERRADMDILRAELPAVHEDTWRDLVRGIGSDCTAMPTHWALAYSNVADALLDRRQSLTDRILRANAVGYSSGWRDFLDDLYPL